MRVDKKSLQTQMNENPFLHLEDVIYQNLRNEIIGLRVAPDSKLNESKMADDLGVSRTPIRNALQRLEEEGLVHKASNRVPVVSRLTKDACYQIMDARLAVEGHAAFLAASQITEEELEELKIWINRYQKASRGKKPADILEHSICDHHFHALIIQASRNQLIQEMYQKIEGRIFYYRNYLYHTLKPEDLQRILAGAVRQHMTTYHALRLGFAEMAQAAVEADARSMVGAFMVWDELK